MNKEKLVKEKRSRKRVSTSEKKKIKGTGVIVHDTTKTLVSYTRVLIVRDRCVDICTYLFVHLAMKFF